MKAYPYLISPFINNIKEMKENFNGRIKEIYEEWEKSKNYPRKKKKKTRKRLLIDYSVFSWGIDMFDDKFSF